MFLTKVSLDLRNPSIRAALADCQKMHRLVLRLFDKERAAAQVLYRVSEKGKDIFLYLYSACPAIREDVPSGMQIAAEKDISSWLQQMKEGMQFRFDLLAYPSKKVYREEESRNSRRRTLVTPEERQEWLMRKAEQGGFQIRTVTENGCKHFFGKHSKEQGGSMEWDGYHYNGVLEIKDSQLFCDTIQKGIGAGKSYGLGMLLLM